MAADVVLFTGISLRTAYDVIAAARLIDAVAAA
jgi:hypothetical protein